MTNKELIGLKIFGIGNIVLGIIPALFLIVKSVCYSLGFFGQFIFYILGLVTDRGFMGFWDWFILSVIGRACIISFCVFSLYLLWSGIAMLRTKPSGRKLAIVSSSVITCSYITYNVSNLIHGALYRKDIVINFKVLQQEILIALVLLIYTFCLIRYLNRPDVVAQFDQKIEKVSLNKTIIFILMVVFGGAIPFLNIVVILVLFGYFIFRVNRYLSRV